MKKSLFPFILIVVFLLVALAPNCTKTITEIEYVTDTVLVKPLWAICGDFYRDENDQNLIYVWAIIRNITDLDGRFQNIPDPKVGILCFDDNRKWKQFVQGVSEDISVVLDRDTSYSEISVLKPGKYAFMFFKFTKPSFISISISFVGLSGNELPPGGLSKPAALSLGEAPTPELIEKISRQMELLE